MKQSVTNGRGEWVRNSLSAPLVVNILKYPARIKCLNSAIPVIVPHVVYLYVPAYGQEDELRQSKPEE